MTPVTALTRGERIYFVAVAGATLWVGGWSLLLPGRVDVALPFLVPPLHARFLGAFYLSALVAMTGCRLARSAGEFRIIMAMVAIWTGMVFLVSLRYLDEFDLSVPHGQIWFVAYAIFPLIAVWVGWRHRGDPTPPGPAIPGALKRSYLVEGVALTALGLVLLVVPGAMVSAWPWPITRLLSQLYAAPFLAYGVMGVLMARADTWPEIRIAAAALGTFAVLALVASLLHLGLFSASDAAAWLWFAGLLGATAIALSTALRMTGGRNVVAAS